MELIKILLASSVIAGLTSVIVSYFTSLRLKKLDFKNEYYKEIFKKRLNAYQNIENQIAVLKSVVLGNDNKPYHMIFSSGESEFYKYQQNLMLAISSSLWIDDKTTKELEKLNNLFFNINNRINNKNQIEIEEIGKEYYQRLADLRFNLENLVKTGLYDLHDVKKAFIIKRKNEKRTIYTE